MAKRTNILRMLKSEIEKGNNIILPNGNFVDESYLLGEILKAFTDDLKTGKIDMSVTPDDYRNKKLSECVKADIVLVKIMEILGEDNTQDDKPQEQEQTPQGKEVIADGTGQTDANNGTSRKDARCRNKDSKKANA